MLVFSVDRAALSSVAGVNGLFRNGLGDKYFKLFGTYDPY